MRTIRWLVAGGALLAAAGVALIVSDAEAQVVRLFPGDARLLTQPETNRVLGAIAGCWPLPLTTVRSVRLYRGDGADAGAYFADITGEDKHTRSEAIAMLRARERVPPGLRKVVEPVNRCAITRTADIRDVENIAGVLWPYAIDTWRSSTFIRGTSTGPMRCMDTRGAIGISEDAAVTAIENGEDVQIVGVIE
jgi:hypothetical protein